MSLTLLIVLIVLLALMFYAIEAFVTPGIGVASVLGTVCVVVDCVLVYFAAGAAMAVLAVLASTALVLLFFWWLGRSKALDRVSLHTAIDSTAATAEQLSVRPGDEGVALTRLALIGNAEIGGKTVEVKSVSGFLDEGAPVVVTEVRDALILVRRR